MRRTDPLRKYSERKIDQIENRLGSIESLLKNISLGSSTGATTDAGRSAAHTPASGSRGIPTCSSGDFDSSDGESAYGGDSGFTNQTAFASEFLEHAVQRTSLREANPGIELALANLRQLVEVQRQRTLSHGPRFPLQKPVPPEGLGTLAMPPVEMVVPLLKRYKSAIT